MKIKNEKVEKTVETNPSVLLLKELIGNGDMVIVTNSKKQRIYLASLFNNYNGKNLAKDFEWDEPIGNEIL